MNKKSLTNICISPPKYVIPTPKTEPPIVGITYLDKSQYGLQHLFKSYRGNDKYVKQFESFLEKARSCSSINELIKNHSSHINSKNSDSKSKDKVKYLCEKYNLDVQDLVHLHCCTGGTGEFVLHGFIISNRFEIIWLDPKHEIHK